MQQIIPEKTIQQVHEPVEMVDLKKQYLKIKPAIDAAIQECINTTAFIKGPQVSQFESELADYLRVKHVITCANGTDALQLAMMALDLKPGDEVIVPAFTYVATAEVIALLGLKPVMIDVDPKTFNITEELVKEAVTEKTKLVVPVHLFGQCAEVEGISRLSKSMGIYVVEDTAQALGAQYTFSNGIEQLAGTIGDLGTTSFFPSKNLGCFGDGGAVFTNNDDLAKRVRMIANHGQAKKYYHEIVGINSRLDTIQAAILLEKLKKLDEYAEARNSVADKYDRSFAAYPTIKIPYRSPSSSHVFHQYTIQVPIEKRDGLKEHLHQKGIPSMIYYPLPLNKQLAFKDTGRIVGDLEITEELCKSVISIPMHTELSEMQVDYISESVTEYLS